MTLINWLGHNTSAQFIIQNFKDRKVDCRNSGVQSVNDITKTRLFKYIENFTTQNWKLSGRNSDIFFIFLLKTYVFEQYKKNNVYPCKPQFYYIKVGLKEVKII